LCRVHKDILALHCTVFASLFDGPQDAFDTGSERHGGVPVVDLPDAANDVRDFLKALHFPQETQRHSRITSPVRNGGWNVFPLSNRGIFRLAAKYDATEIAKLLRPLLVEDWPNVLKDWVFLHDKLRSVR
ncbi:hypothetical protein BV25DRAFT_1762065, partial [Artomyces pyxidatus]